MTERKLTPEQIDNLFELCEIHNVHYYDVQIELVDHIASAIEALWETNPELSFEEVIFLVGEQFGIESFTPSSYDSILPSITGLGFSGKSGFEAIEIAKEKELRNKYDRMQRKYIGEFFKLPKIILTLAITFALFYVFKLSNNDIVISYFIQGFCILSFAVYLIFIYPKKFRLNIVDGKSFLLYDHFKTIRRGAIGSGLASINIIPLLTKFNHIKFDFSFLGFYSLELFSAFLITFFGIMIVTLYVYTPQRVKEDFTSEFPQFVKS